MILAWNSLWKSLSWPSSLPVSSHFYAPLRPCNLVPRDLPPQGQIEEKPGKEVAQSQRNLFTGLHYRKLLTYLLLASWLCDCATRSNNVFFFCLHWQTGQFRMWVNGKLISGLETNGNYVCHLHNRFHLQQIGRKSSDLSCSESVCLQIYVLAVSPQSRGSALFAS